jgi:hypothetical protein
MPTDRARVCPHLRTAEEVTNMEQHLESALSLLMALLGAASLQLTLTPILRIGKGLQESRN